MDLPSAFIGGNPQLFLAPDSGPTPNLYDLSQHGSNSDTVGHSFQSAGAIYKIQKFDGTHGWSDYESDAYDEADRLTAQYEHYATLDNQKVSASKTNLYDLSSTTTGLLAREEDGLGEAKSYFYDADAHETSFGYNVTEPSASYVYDADGNATTVTSTSLGASNRVYDALGNRTSFAEFSGGGVSDPATLSYQYYPDGTKEAVGVASTTYTYAQLKQYSYRVDGQVQTLGFQQTNQNITYGYTQAGRLSSGGGVDNSSYAYTNGVRSSYTIGTTSVQVTSDAEGSTTRLSPSNDAPQAFVYNSRNEIVDDYLLPPDQNDYIRVQRYHDGGYIVPITTLERPLTRPPAYRPTPGPVSYDALNGVLLGHTTSAPDTPATPGADPIPFTPDQAHLLNSGDTYGLDVQGRETSHSLNQTYEHYESEGAPCTQKNSATTTRAYDYENHLISQDTTKTSNIGVCGVTTSSTKDFGATTLAWSPDEHPVLESSVPIEQGAATTNFTLHWDGDELLFVTDSTSNLTIAYLDSNAYYLPPTSLLGSQNNSATSIVAIDRDSGGNEIGSQSQSSQPDSSLNTGTVMPIASFNYIKSDGLDLGTFSKNMNSSDIAPGGGQTPIDPVTVQGGRVYDSQMGSWTTPDAYKGELADPASMERYMWNGNNPVSYSDPSGFVFKNFEDPESGGGGESIESGEGPMLGVSPGTEGGAGPIRGGYINPENVRYSQDSVGASFRNGQTLQNTANGLRDGTIDPSKFPAVRLIERNGQLVTLDNRRLVVFKEAGVMMPAVMARNFVTIAKEAFGKMSSGVDGIYVQLRFVFNGK